jgi:hypothetical protein
MRVCRRSQDRSNRGAWLFRDSTLQTLEILLYEAFHIPGAGIGFGLGGIVGLIPDLRGVLAGLPSLVVPLAAWLRGATYGMLHRMAANPGIGVLVGSVPIFGDIFDIALRANRETNCCFADLWTSLAVSPSSTGVFCSCCRCPGAHLRHSRGSRGVAHRLAPNRL